MTTDERGFVRTSSEFGDEVYPAIIQRPDGADLFAVKLTKRQLEIVVAMLGFFGAPTEEFDPNESRTLYGNLYDAAETLNVETNPYTVLGLEIPPEIARLTSLVEQLRTITGKTTGELANDTTTGGVVGGEGTDAG